MDWIKKKPAQLALTIIAALTLGSAALLYTKIDSFKGAFNDVNIPPSKDSKIPPVESEKIAAAEKSFGAPAQWESGKSKEERGSG